MLASKQENSEEHSTSADSTVKVKIHEKGKEIGAKRVEKKPRVRSVRGRRNSPSRQKKIGEFFKPKEHTESSSADDVTTDNEVEIVDNKPSELHTTAGVNRSMLDDPFCDSFDIDAFEEQERNASIMVMDEVEDILNEIDCGARKTETPFYSGFQTASRVLENSNPELGVPQAQNQLVPVIKTIESNFNIDIEEESTSCSARKRPRADMSASSSPSNATVKRKKNKSEDSDQKVLVKQVKHTGVSSTTASSKKKEVGNKVLKTTQELLDDLFGNNSIKIEENSDADKKKNIKLDFTNPVEDSDCVILPQKNSKSPKEKTFSRDKRKSDEKKRGEKDSSKPCTSGTASKSEGKDKPLPKQDMADFTVRCLMPYYKEGKIESKEKFKSIARELSHKASKRGFTGMLFT